MAVMWLRKSSTAEPRPRRALSSCLFGLVVLLALSVATGCGSSGATPSTSAATATPTPILTPELSPSATDTLAPTPEPTPMPSFLTAGFSTPEGAIKAWILAQGFEYSGDCETGPYIDNTYCYSFSSTGSSGRIYMVAPRAAEPAYWMLVSQSGDLWYVADVRTFAGTSGAPSDWT
jgi:hypothetical protein